MIPCGPQRQRLPRFRVSAGPRLIRQRAAFRLSIGRMHRRHGVDSRRLGTKEAVARYGSVASVSFSAPLRRGASGQFQSYGRSVNHSADDRFQGKAATAGGRSNAVVLQSSRSRPFSHDRYQNGLGVDDVDDGVNVGAAVYNRVHSALLNGDPPVDTASSASHSLEVSRAPLREDARRPYTRVPVWQT